MKISTFTVVVGNTACNARCPYCVSKMTPACGADKVQSPNMRNFEIACKYARQSGVSTVLFTGKGEPTLFTPHINMYMSHVRDFPFVELQTNGLNFFEAEMRNALETWYALGMTTISLSVAHYNLNKNSGLLYPDHQGFDFWTVADMLHEIGFSVRINCTMVRGYIDTVDEVLKFAEVCRERGVEQFTARPVTAPDESEDEAVAEWVAQNHVGDLPEFLNDNLDRLEATRLLELPHGATVFDYEGQNLCVANCLTSNKDPEKIRQLIFFPDGHLRYDWKYEGAIIL